MIDNTVCSNVGHIFPPFKQNSARECGNFGSIYGFAWSIFRCIHFPNVFLDYHIFTIYCGNGVTEWINIITIIAGHQQLITYRQTRGKHGIYRKDLVCLISLFQCRPGGTVGIYSTNIELTSNNRKGFTFQIGLVTTFSVAFTVQSTAIIMRINVNIVCTVQTDLDCISNIWSCHTPHSLHNHRGSIQHHVGSRRKI